MLVPIIFGLVYNLFVPKTPLTKSALGFIRALKPPHVVLVHGEANEMSNLKRRLIEEYENDPTHNIEVHNPRNTVSVDLYFSEEKTAKVYNDYHHRIVKFHLHFISTNSYFLSPIKH